MNWSATFLGSLSLQQNLDFCLRILIALLCGGAIGFERSRHFKEAGIRTHVIVCVGAALIMVVSKYGFVDLALDGGAYYPGTRGADASRIAAQVVSGISFLGAGVIFKREGRDLRAAESDLPFLYRLRRCGHLCLEPAAFYSPKRL